MKNNIFLKHLPKENIYDDLNIGTITDIYNKVESNSGEDERSVIILDDQASNIKLVEHELKIILYNRRHLKTTILMTLQTLKCLSLSLRKVIDNLFVFKISKKETESIIEEFIEQPKEVALKLMNLYDKPHQWLLINVPDKRLWFMTDEIIISDD